MKKTFYFLCLIFLLTTSLVAISPDYTVESIHFYPPDAQTVAQITLRPYQNTSGLDDLVVKDKKGRFANYLLQSITTQNPQLKESASIKLLQSYAKERCVWAGVVGEAIFSTLNLDLQCPAQKQSKRTEEKKKKAGHWFKHQKAPASSVETLSFMPAHRRYASGQGLMEQLLHHPAKELDQIAQHLAQPPQMLFFTDVMHNAHLTTGEPFSIEFCGELAQKITNKTETPAKLTNWFLAQNYIGLRDRDEKDVIYLGPPPAKERIPFVTRWHTTHNGLTAILCHPKTHKPFLQTKPLYTCNPLFKNSTPYDAKNNERCLEDLKDALMEKIADFVKPHIQEVISHLKSEDASCASHTSNKATDKTDPPQHTIRQRIRNRLPLPRTPKLLKRLAARAKGDDNANDYVS